MVAIISYYNYIKIVLGNKCELIFVISPNIMILIIKDLQFLFHIHRYRNFDAPHAEQVNQILLISIFNSPLYSIHTCHPAERYPAETDYTLRS